MRHSLIMLCQNISKSRNDMMNKNKLSYQDIILDANSTRIKEIG